MPFFSSSSGFPTSTLKGKGMVEDNAPGIMLNNDLIVPVSSFLVGFLLN